MSAPSVVSRAALALTAALTAQLLVAPARAVSPGGGEACKAEKIAKSTMVDFQTAFAAAEKRAKNWQADAVVARLTHTTLGPIDAEGRSANWLMVFYSPKTQGSDMITIANGRITCWASSNPAGRLPALGPNFYRDVKTLLREAAAHGGAAYLSQGYTPTVELSAGSKGVAYWYVNYTHPQKRAGVQVMFDGNSGKFVSALK